MLGPRHLKAGESVLFGVQVPVPIPSGPTTSLLTVQEMGRPVVSITPDHAVHVYGEMGTTACAVPADLADRFRAAVADTTGSAQDAYRTVAGWLGLTLD